MIMLSPPFKHVFRDMYNMCISTCLNSNDIDSKSLLRYQQDSSPQLLTAKTGHSSPHSYYKCKMSH